MKFSKLFVVGLACTTMLAVGCNNSDEKGGGGEAGEAVLRISLQGDGTRATGTNPSENKVNKFTVYVFNSENDVLEASQTVTNQTSTTVSGLSTGFPKKIVVIANAPATFPKFEEGDLYTNFTHASHAFNLATQSPDLVATNGLVMYGETTSPVTLNPTGITQVGINVKRLAAKVRLGTITVIPTGDNDIEEFRVTGVGIQRAYSSTDIFGNVVNPNSLFAGIDGGSFNGTVQPFLYDALDATFAPGIAQNFGNYFYVLPNESADSCTLLTLVSEYYGDEQYFPIKINATQGDVNTDGMYIKSNGSYIINIVVNNLGEGTTDPDVPPTTASLEAIITVDPWDVDIVQDVIW